jgi:hypothetical protein
VTPNTDSFDLRLSREIAVAHAKELTTTK